MAPSPPLPPGMQPATPLFPSILEVQDNHDGLLRRLDVLGEGAATDEKLWHDVAAAVQLVRAVGAQLDLPRDRRIAQSILDFWSSALYRAGRPSPPARLADFDPNLAPELPDEPCPYQGLAAFHEEESGFFFGRDTLLEDTFRRLAGGERFLAVVGESGSGKSSFVLGGLLPQLRAGRVGSLAACRVVTLVPGSRPLANLAAALPRALSSGTTPSLATAGKLLFADAGLRGESQHLVRLLDETGKAPALVVVDQFEEVFTLCPDAVEREQFARQLLAVAQAPGSYHAVMLTMRTDFLDQVATIPVLFERFRHGRVDVGALSLNELRAAIEMPAAKVGLRFEEGIVDDLVAKILGERAGLPLLQFTLRKLWDRRQRNRITRKIYAEIGDPREALGRAAEMFYGSLIPQDQETARRILLCMVRPGEGREVTSNRIPRAEVFRAGEASDRVERVLERLIAAGLVKETRGSTAADAQIEVAHEALIRNCRLLTGWLDDERVELRKRRLLTDRARAWNEGRASLLRGPELREAERLPDLNEQEAALVDASKTEESREETERQEEAKRRIALLEALAAAEARKAVLARRAALALTLLLAVALGAAVFGFIKAKEAARSREEALRNLGLANTNAALAADNRIRAEHEAHRARMNSAALIAQQEVAKERPDYSLALLAGLEAVAEGRAADPRVPAAAYLGLAVAVDHSPRFVRRLNHLGMVFWAVYSPDGEFIVTGGSDHTARIWEGKTGRELRSLTGHGDEVVAGAYSPDGRFIVTGSSDQTARVWEAGTGSLVGTLEGHTEEVSCVAYNTNGQFIVTGSADGTARVWDAASRREVVRLKGHDGAVNAVAYSPDGLHVVTGGDDGTARIWETESWTTVGRLGGHLGAVFSTAYSPDGRWIVTGSYDDTARVWRAETHEEVGRLDGHEDSVWSAAYSPDGRFLVTGSADGSARIWRWELGGLEGPVEFSLNPGIVCRFEGHTDTVYSAAFSPDGRFVLTGSRDGTARVWEANAGQELRRWVASQDSIASAGYSPDGRYIVTADRKGYARIWEAPSGRELRRLEGHTDRVCSAAYSPEGQFIVTSSRDQTARIWNAETGQNLRPLVGHRSGVNAAAYSPDGRFIVTASDDRTARIWQAETGNLVHQLAGHDDRVYWAAYSPDGQRLITGSEDRTARIWNVESAATLIELAGHKGGVNSTAYSPDGRLIVTASEDRTARIWSATTGRGLQDLAGHRASVKSAAFSPDGRFVVTASRDCTARIWEAETGRELRRLEGYGDAGWVTGQVESAAYSPDGRFLVAAYGDGVVRIWPAGLDLLIELAGKRIQREPPEFTPEERRAFGLDEP